MKIQTDCKKCKSKIVFRTMETDRISMSMSKGKFITLKCKQCGLQSKYHLNELEALKNRLFLIIALLVFIIGTVITFTWTVKVLYQVSNIYLAAGIGGLIGIPFFVYSTIQKGIENKVRTFNSMKINQ